MQGDQSEDQQSIDSPMDEIECTEERSLLSYFLEASSSELFV